MAYSIHYTRYYIRYLEAKYPELRYNPNHDPKNGRFCSGKTSTVNGNAFDFDIGNKEGVDKSVESGIIKKIHKVYSFKEYYNQPKLLGESTHKEKYDYYTNNNYDVKPLGKGSLQKVPYNKGGGYRVAFEDKQSVLSYHPKAEAGKVHHHGKDEYYKLSTGGGTGQKTVLRFNMDGTKLHDEKK